jgi:FtsP/CotA-like multicopper oxidase with cupredoxin domain
LAGGNGNQTTYIFGFRDATGLAGGPLSLKGQAQASAPLLFVDENTDITIRLTNAGLQQRPDLVDSHTIHWHGFRNAIPLFDGVPEMSISVPIGANFTYYYKPVNAGTYMYHCHFEDVEHIHMGMTGVIFVRPIQNKGLNWNDPSDPLNSGTKTAMFGTTPIPTGTGYKYAYNDGVLPGDPNSTFYHREFALFLSEVWAQAHWNDAHIQATDWSEYAPDFWLMNGRSYPDTLALGSDPLTVPTDPRLQFQPISSLITANAGEQVLLRLVTLGYQQAAMTVPGITLRTIAKDAVYLKSRDNTSTAFDTNTVYIGPGESTDVIFTAPTFIGGNGAYDTYYLYNRNYVDSTNDSSASGGFGGQMTEIRVYPANTLLDQTTPNT